MVSSMGKVPTSLRAVIYTRANGNMGNGMDEAFSYILMVTSMKAIIMMINEPGKEHSLMQMMINIIWKYICDYLAIGP